MIFTKKLTYKNPNHLELIRQLPCFICGKPGPSDVEHWKTVGSGGHDHLNNLNAMCRNCHILKGAMGVESFWVKFGDLIKKARKRYNLPRLIIDSDFEDQ